MGNRPFTTGRVVVGTVALLTAVLFGTACGSGLVGGGNETAGGAGVAAPPADNSGATVYVSTRFADASAWLCGGETALCGAQRTRTVLGADAAPHTIVVSAPTADCFMVHSDGESDPATGAVVAPLPTARALAPMCQVYVPNLTQATATATLDETLDAFRHYADHQNDGRPFVVVSDSTAGARTSLTILDEIRSRPDLQRRYVASILPGMAGDLAAEALPFCTVLEHLGCVITSPIVRDPNVASDPVPGISAGWAGACVNPADVEARPALLPDWMVVDDGTSTVDCDVLALVEVKIEALGLVRTTNSR